MSEFYTGNLHPLGEDASLWLPVGLQMIYPMTTRQVGEVIVVDLGQPSLAPEKLQVGSIFFVHKGECSMFLSPVSPPGVSLVSPSVPCKLLGFASDRNLT